MIIYINYSNLKLKQGGVSFFHSHLNFFIYFQKQHILFDHIKLSCSKIIRIQMLHKLKVKAKFTTYIYKILRKVRSTEIKQLTKKNKSQGSSQPIQFLQMILCI